MTEGAHQQTTEGLVRSTSGHANAAENEPASSDSSTDALETSASGRVPDGREVMRRVTVIRLQRRYGNQAVMRYLNQVQREDSPDSRVESGPAVVDRMPAVVQRAYPKNVLVSTLYYLKSLTLDLPLNLLRLLKHILVGLPVAVFDIGAEVVRAVAAGLQGDWSGLGKHLLDALLSGLGWPLRLFAKVMDLVGFGPGMDLLMQIFKPGTRPLNAAELAALNPIFGGELPYDQVRVDDHSLLNQHVFRFWLAFTTWHTVNFPPGSGFASDPGTFVHEMTHVWQMRRRGTQYIAEAPYHGGLDGSGYVYGVDRNFANANNGLSLHNARATGKTIYDYGLEQQAEICNHYYMRSANGLPVANWQPYINDIQGLSGSGVSLKNRLRVWVRQPGLTV